MDGPVSTADGRVLLVSQLGEPTGPAILSIHGSGMGRIVYPPYLEDAVERGVRVLSYDRPGLGGSTRRAGYRVADCADDVRAITAALGLERLAVWGVSGGAPFALACAARLPDLVVAVASVEGSSPPVPSGDADARWNDPDAVLAEYAEKAATDRAQAAKPDGMIEAYYSDDLCPADVEALHGPVGAWFAADAR